MIEVTPGYSHAESQEKNEMRDTPNSEHISAAALGEDTELDPMTRPSAEVH